MIPEAAAASECSMVLIFSSRLVALLRSLRRQSYATKDKSK
jgi:hypothetical protein